jgi:hypothetical protein
VANQSRRGASEIDYEYPVREKPGLHDFCTDGVYFFIANGTGYLPVRLCRG